jgi:endonuclease YncB( thermonuclease family)
MWSINYSFVKDGVWIDANGDHYGALDATGIEYEKTLMLAGNAYLVGDAQSNYLLNAQRQAKEAGTGLWTTCPGFGA